MSLDLCTKISEVYPIYLVPNAEDMPPEQRLSDDAMMRLCLGDYKQNFINCTLKFSDIQRHNDVSNWANRISNQCKEYGMMSTWHITQNTLKLNIHLTQDKHDRYCKSYDSLIRSILDDAVIHYDIYFNLEHVIVGDSVWLDNKIFLNI